MTGFFTLLCIGILTGFYNGFEESSYKESTSKKHLFKRKILISTLAAFTIPLFLTVIGNGIIADFSKIEQFSKEFYYLVGFAILAALGANKYLDGLSARLLDQVEESQNEIEKIQENEKNVQNKLNEIDQKEIRINTLIEQLENKAKLALEDSILARAEATLNGKDYERGVKLLDEYLMMAESIDPKEKFRLLVNKAYALKHMQISPDYEELIKVLDEAMMLEVGDELLSYALYNKICYLALSDQEEKIFETIDKLGAINKIFLEDLKTESDFKKYVSDDRFINLMLKYSIESEKGNYHG